MVGLKIIHGNLLTAKEQFICHQCNCISASVSGLARSIINAFPYANIYSDRDTFNRTEPGTISISGNGKDQRYIINMFAQYYPGKYNDDYWNDSSMQRLSYFKSCLDRIEKIYDLESIAFPYCIGCGIGGGDWVDYEAMLLEFSIDIGKEITIYKIKE